jgi:hypothetical protein
MLKTYYLIFHDPMEEEYIYNLTLLACSEDPSVVGEHMSPAAQTFAMRNTEEYDEEMAMYRWIKGKLLVKVIADPNTTPTIYVGEEGAFLRFHERKEVDIMLGQEELDDWLDSYSITFPEHERIMEGDTLHLISTPCYSIYKVSLLKEFNSSTISKT